jgi:hypothetical protein
MYFYKREMETIIRRKVEKTDSDADDLDAVVRDFTCICTPTKFKLYVRDSSVFSGLARR